MSRAALCALALGAGWLCPGLARAQERRRIEVSAAAIVASARSRVLTDTVETWGGLWLGGTVGAKLGRVSASVTGFRGTLSPIVNAAFERDAGQVDARVRFDPRSWVGAEATYTVRAFSSIDYQRWTLFGIGLRLSGALGDSAVRVYARASYLPFVSATVPASADHGVGAEAGLSADVSRWTIAVTYHFERYDFAGGASARLEEFDWIGLQVGYRFRWLNIKAGR